MTGEKKSSDLANRLNVKTGKKLLSKTSKPSSSTISSPPKAALASTSANKEDVHRRRNLNDILRRRSGDGTVIDRPTPPKDVAIDDAQKSTEAVNVVDTHMADRVAELERALSLAKQEQQALREALEETRRHREDVQDAASKPQQRHSQPLEDAHEAPHHVTVTDSAMHDEDVDHWSDSRSSPRSVEIVDLRPSSSHSQDDLHCRNYDLRYKLARLEDQLITQENAHRMNLGHVSAHKAAELNDLRTRLHATEKESQERLQQLLSLKSSISSLTRIDAQVTDSELSDAFDQLANRVREWVVSNYRKTRLHVGDLPAETVEALRSVTPAYEMVESPDRLALYQALVANALMRIFDEPLVFGLPKTGSFGALQSFAESVQATSTGSREWRRATIRLIEGNEGTAIALHRGKTEALHRLAVDVARLLFTLTSVELSSNAHSALMGILSTAANLQRTLVLQKARYKVLFFRSVEGDRQLTFDERRMESVNDMDNMMDDEEGPGASERKFMFCVFPCLEKSGDEKGDNIQIINVLRKARVCCGTS